MLDFGLQNFSLSVCSQAESFEADLEVTGLREPKRPFTGVFIRAPVRLSTWLTLFDIKL